MKLPSWLAGRKTHLCALGIALIAAARYLGWLGDSEATFLLGLFGGGGLSALRSGIAKRDVL